MSNVRMEYVACRRHAGCELQYSGLRHGPKAALCIRLPCSHASPEGGATRTDQHSCRLLAHRDLASRIHVGNATESGQTRTGANDPGCVKTCRSAEGRKYNSLTRYRAKSVQYD